MTIGAVGEKCDCGAEDWCITATLIECRSCKRLWGRVNGKWIPKFCPVCLSTAPVHEQACDCV